MQRRHGGSGYTRGFAAKVAQAAVCTALLLTACNSDKAKTLDSAQLVGVWSHLVEGGERRVMVQFRADGTYDLTREGAVHTWPGNFELSGDALRLVDLYCGTALPGVYAIAVKRKGTATGFRLTKVDDEMCVRGKMLEGEWVREEMQNLPGVERPE